MKKVILILISVLIVTIAIVYFSSTKNTNSKESIYSETTVMDTSSTEPSFTDIRQNKEAESKCNGLKGELEINVLVGPAEVAGMSPIAVGSIPFSITKNEKDFLVQGEGYISYNETSGQTWGTYTVTLEMDATLEGSCSGNPGNEILNIVAETTGTQMTEVRAEGFSKDYPWEGTQTLKLSFPLVEGASSDGEGWSFVLHIDNK